MTISARAALALCGLVQFFVVATVGASAAPPVEAFGNLPDVKSMRLSPDGHHIGAIQPVDGRPQVIIYEFTSTGVKRYGFSVADAIAESVRWHSNDKLIAIYQANKKISSDIEIHNWQRSFSMSAQAGNPVRLMDSTINGATDYHTGSIVDMAIKDPQHVYMMAWEYRQKGDPDTRLSRDASSYNVFEVDVDSGHGSPSEIGDTKTVNWVMDGDGHAVARVDRDPDTLVDTVSVGGAGSWHAIYSYDASGGGEAGVEGLLENGNTLGVARYNEGGLATLYPLGFGDTKLGSPIFSDPTYDLDETIHDEWTGRIIGVAYDADKTEYRYFDSDREALQRKLESALPGQTIRIMSADMAKDAYIVLSSGARQPPLFQLFTPATSQLSFLAAQYPGLTSADLGEVKPYPYKARDGLDIHAYLTLPPGKPAHNLPTVIFPHGGPQARDTMDFDWWAQFMASRGYAVLQPNFRGSSGYGIQFQKAGYGQWGAKMQDDISDGVKKLIADGIADPKRICIVGASYGGYAALAGVTFTPDLYACAVAYAPVSDLPAMVGWVAKHAGERSATMSFEDASIGSRFTDAKQLDATSPARHADQVRVPVLIVHSDKDTTVPIVQGQEENDALQLAGKNVQFITLSGDDHYLELGTTRVQLLKAVETFLAAHIGN
jgi:dipeptidyl aminopeptidase/acylaminoacyl peptidase